MTRPSLSNRQRHPFRSVARLVAGPVGRIAVIAACAVAQCGCAAVTGGGVSTGKTPLDTVYSWAAGKDCSIVRGRFGDAYCVEDELAAPAAAHCYPTLGEITCYTTPDPFHGRQREVGSMPLVARQAKPAALADGQAKPAALVDPQAGRAAAVNSAVPASSPTPAG